METEFKELTIQEKIFDGLSFRLVYLIHDSVFYWIRLRDIKYSKKFYSEQDAQLLFSPELLPPISYLPGKPAGELTRCKLHRLSV